MHCYRVVNNMVVSDGQDGVANISPYQACLEASRKLHCYRAVKNTRLQSRATEIGTYITAHGFPWNTLQHNGYMKFSRQGKFYYLEKLFG